MAAESTVTEFQLWLTAVVSSTSTVEEKLRQQPPNIDELADSLEDLEFAIDQLERFRPTNNRQIPYEFKPAVIAIVAAKQLAVKAKRKLPKQIEVIPPITTSTVSKKIPDIKITPFDGDVTKFSNFIKAFEMKFHDLPISDSEKLVQLLDCVTDGPAKVIESLAITDENYSFAISSLKKQYDHPDEIISALYRKLEQLPTASNNPHSLLNTYYEVQGILLALEAHGHDLNAFPPLRDNVYSRYPVNIIQQICVNERLPVERLQAEILKLAQFRLKLDAAKPKSSNTPTTPQKHGVSASLTATKQEKPAGRANTSKNESAPRQVPPCAFCAQIHYSASCTNYTTLDSRRGALKDRCFLCLKSNHTKATCRRQITCHYCKLLNQHHSSLCPQQFGKKTETASTDSSKTVDTVAQNETPVRTADSKSSYFVRTHTGAHVTAQVIIEHPDTHRKHKLRALLDNGSNESYIAETAAHRIGLKLTNQRNVPVSVFLKSHPVNLKTASTSFLLTNNRDFQVPVVVDTSPALPQQVHLFDYDAFKTTYPEHANKKFIEQAEHEPIELLLGGDYYYDLIENKITVTEGLYLNATKFGWMLVGRQPCDVSPRATYFQMSPTEAIHEICSLEALGIKEMPLSEIEEEERALAQFYENLRFVDGRYEIRWPWRQYPPNLKNNFGLAVGRLKSLQRRMTEESFDSYNEIIESQIEKGIVEDVPANELADVKYFLPHHVVETPEKSTTARMVFDGSAKTASSNSINDQIYKGRNLLANSGKIIIRFRLRLIVVVSDLEKAFNALAINRADTNYVCFLWLWRFDMPPTGKNLRILRFLRMLFGITACPFLLEATIQYHLRKYAKKFKKFRNFVQRLLEDGFVDNFITGFLTILQALQYYEFAIQVFKECSMNLRRWASNNAELREKFEQPDKSAAISILGVIWNQYTDQIHLRKIQEVETLTLRTILSSIAQFYDPCGIWTPILVSAKIFLRDLHTHYNWDDELNEEHKNQWQNLRFQLQSAASKPLPRFQCTIDETESVHYSLHVFTDASTKACACAVYLRKEKPNQSEVHLLFSKTKLAKLSHVPKLELIAMLLGIKALEYVSDAITIKCDRFLWCDSKCVLHWIMSDKILPSFIQKRVEYIRNVPNVEKRYVSSANNPADLPSRGTTFENVPTQWFNGPTWLSESQGNWPPALPSSAIILDEYLEPDIPKTVAVVTSTKYPFDLDPTTYSSYMKLIRVTTHLMRFVSSFRIAHTRQLFVDSTNSSAQKLWIKFEQQSYYHDVIAALNLRKKHELVSKLNLYLDQSGILRCAGRFRHAPLSPNERNPILLPPPKHSRFVLLLVEFYHASAFHAGTSAVLASIRRKFWIPAGRRAIQNIIRTCKKCTRYNARPYEQPQHSDVPIFRFEDHCTPFANVGIDTFGPIWANNEKRFVLLVTDLVIRAVDLEMLEDMSANVIFLAFRTIIARRTYPKLIVSDNAPQFKAVCSAFENIYVHEWNWKFLPEHSPWEGGAYERLVGLSKSALLKTFHNRGVTDLVLRTTLAEIARTLNDRPLTYVSNEKDDMEPLTPNHFLKSYFPDEGIVSIQSSEGITASTRQLITISKCCNANNDNFWAIWRSSYLQFLREKGFHRNEAFQRQTSPKSPELNAIVLIAEKHIKRSAWKLGRIIRLNKSADGKIRSVTLKTAHGNLIRPLTEIYPLEITAAVDELPLTDVAQDGDVPEPRVASDPADQSTVVDPDDEWEIIEEEIHLDF